MTATWNFHFLIREGSLTIDALRSVVACIDDAGFTPVTLDDGSIPAWSGDGSGFLFFSSERAAIEWIARDEGLVSYRDRDNSTELSLSVHVVHGVLQRELSDVPDQPSFDDVVVTLAHPSEANPTAADLLVSVMPRIAELLNAEYVYGLDDDALESVLGLYCVHRRVSAGQLPPFLGWFNAAPLGSTTADYLKKAASLVDAHLHVENGYVVLALSERFADLPPGRLLDAGRRLRDATADRGCE